MESSIRTNWTAVVVTLLPAAILVSGLLYYALQPDWLGHDDWAAGVLALLPIEGLRIFVLLMRRDAYNTARTARDALKFFLAGCALLAGIVSIIALLVLGPRGLLAALADPHLQALVAPPVALTLIDGIVGFYSLQGNPRVEAAKLDAVITDAWDWFALSVARWGPVVLIPSVFWAFSQSESLDTDGWRRIVLCCVAIYLAGKAVLFAHVHTAHFLRTGKCLLSAAWIQALLIVDRKQREQNTQDENQAAERRRAVLAGESARLANA